MTENVLCLKCKLPGEWREEYWVENERKILVKKSVSYRSPLRKVPLGYMHEACLNKSGL